MSEFEKVFWEQARIEIINSGIRATATLGGSGNLVNFSVYTAEEYEKLKEEILRRLGATRIPHVRIRDVDWGTKMKVVAEFDGDAFTILRPHRHVSWFWGAEEATAVPEISLQGEGFAPYLKGNPESFSQLSDWEKLRLFQCTSLGVRPRWAEAHWSRELLRARP